MRWSRRLLLLAVALTAATATAQTHGYVFVAPGLGNGGGDSAAIVHLGIGGEAVLPMGIGAGAEVGFLGRTSFDVLGTASINGYYHFKHDRPWAPFVTAGYSNFFTLTGHTNLANLGGGLNYWYKDHFGIKLEVLDHFRGAPDSVNYLEFRLGFNFK